jgi:high-affinity nickel permease
LSVLSVLALGLFLGVRHATDADHVVAVSTIVLRERTTRSAMLVGAMWGLGHTLTVVIIGGAIVAFGLVISARAGLWMEMSVAAMLVALGLTNVLGNSPSAAEVAHSPAPRVPLARLRPLVIGVVHGLAGSAALALLVLTTIDDVGSAIAYLAVFGVGTVIGMMLLTALLALPVIAASRRFVSFERTLALITGLVSVVFGFILAYDVGMVEGLFWAVPAQ